MRKRGSRGISSSNRCTASSRVAFVLIKLAVGGLQKVLGGASIVWANADAEAQCAAANGAIAFPWPRNRTVFSRRDSRSERSRPEQSSTAPRPKTREWPRVIAGAVGSLASKPVTFRTGKAFEKMKLIVSRRKKMEAGQVNPSVRAASHLRTSLAAAGAHASAPMYSHD